MPAIINAACNGIASAQQGLSHDQQATISVPSKSDKISHPEMMGDETEEQNLNETGDPALRIKSDEIEAAFGKKEVKKP